MLTTSAEDFLWNVFLFGLFGDDPNCALEWVGSHSVQDLELPQKLETLLPDYWSSGDKEILLSLALAALESFWLGVEHRTRLAAYVFADGKIDLTQAYVLLHFDGVNLDDLHPSVRKVADVLWLLKQDSDTQVIGPYDDSLLSKTLRNLAEENVAAE